MDTLYCRPRADSCSCRPDFEAARSGDGRADYGFRYFVIFFAGLPWKAIFSAIIAFVAALPLLWNYGMHDYQKTRVLTLLDPTKDPLGAGYHIIQSMIAIGSGGVWGKGWLNGTQTHLDYIPESTTDFISQYSAKNSA